MTEEVEGLEVSLAGQKESTLPEWVRMYDVPGQEKTVLHSLERYGRDKKRDGKRIERLATQKMSYSVEKIREGLTSDNVEVQKACAKMIAYVPLEDKAKLIMEGLASDYVGVQKACAEMIDYLWGNERAKLQEVISGLVRKGLTNEDTATQEAYAEMIAYASMNDRNELIKQGFASDNVEVQKVCAKKILYAPNWNELQKIASGLIRKGLTNEDTATQEAYAEMIDYISWYDRAELRKIVSGLVKRGLACDNPKIQKDYARMMAYAAETDRNWLLGEIKRRGLLSTLIEPPLYRDGKVSMDRFSRKNFDKTGSKTTLIGGELMRKVIVREVTPAAFVAWQKLFEAHEEWKDAGFDYVPVEPIVSFRLKKNGLVEVISGVLDINLSHWRDVLRRPVPELIHCRDKIKEIVKKLKIVHGHDHDNNFCLRFYRDENGEVDLDQTPRVYLIDFDQAVSSLPL